MSGVDEAKFWDREAAGYARSKIKDMAGYERTLERVRELLNAGDRVLEIGCGTGTTALRLAPHVTDYLATDVSPKMIEIARGKLADGAAPMCRFEVVGRGQWPWPDATFDAVLAFNVLHLVVDRPGALGQIRRLLKPGGLFISKTACLGEMNPLIRLAVPVMQVFGKAPHVDFFDGQALAREIAGAGFEIVEESRHGSGRKDPRAFIVARRSASS